LQTVPVEVDETKMFAVTTVLPLKAKVRSAFTAEIEFTNKMTAVLTFDGVLARGKKAPLVFGTKDSHFCSSI